MHPLSRQRIIYVTPTERGEEGGRSQEEMRLRVWGEEVKTVVSMRTGGGGRGEEQGSVKRDNAEGDGRRDIEGKEKSKNVSREPLMADGRVLVERQRVKR